MTEAELLARLRGSEDTLTELKTTGHESVVKKALVAFANSATPERAGVLFLGVKPDGTPAGLQNATAVAEKVATWADECYPSIRFDCVTLRVDGSDVLAVVVPASAERPHFAGPAYVRDGPKTVKAPPTVYENLIASRNTKAGAILRHKGEVISVVEQERWTGTWNAPEKIVELAARECRIEGCSAHSVQFRDISSSSLYSVPLDRVEVSADPVRQRPLKLAINGRVVP